ncbi:MAG: protein kinase [Acidobacteria bacterium]|jgi:serine/threonine-protein kinase|nr:protein kinase [Acidobacteriota bacterium]
MKICSVCHRCYEDTAVACPQENYNSLVAARSGSCEIAGNYRLERLLEDDATGETFEATRINSSEPFIVRLFGGDSFGAAQIDRESILREMRAAATINHPNVNRVFESGVLENGELCSVSEPVDEKNLRDYLRSAGSLSEVEAVTIARQAAEGLEAVHRAGVVHRRISPSSIALASDEENGFSAKLQNFDFGGFGQQIARSGITGGEPQIDILRYMSPEQCAGQAVDARTDIYSLGVVLYEMLTGRSPFDKPTVEAIVHQPINERPLEGIHYEVKALIKHALQLALQKNPSARTPTAVNFARHLRHIEQVAAQSFAFQMPSQSSSANKSVFSTPAAVSNTPAPTFDSFESEKSQPQIISLASEEVTVGAMTNSLVPPLFEKNIEEEAEIETAPIFQAEPILLKKKQSDAIQLVSEPIRIKKKETETISFGPEPIRIKKKETVVAPIASEPIFSSAQSGAGTRARTASSNSISSFDASRPAQRFAPNRQSLFIGAGLAALLAFVGLGAFLYNKQFSESSTPQQPIAAAPAQTSQPEEADSVRSDTLPAVSDSDASESEELSPLPIEESPLQVRKRDEKNQPRQESLTDNMLVKQDAPVKEKTAPEESSPVSAEIAGQNRPRVVSNDGTSQAELNASLNKWITATNARDVDGQMNYYAPKVNSYYLSRNTSQDAVRSDKKRAFERATSVDIKTDKPEIIVSPDGRSAKMRFRKKYVIKEGQRSRNGEVIQELQWVKSGSGWRIVSERDVKIVNR